MRSRTALGRGLVIVATALLAPAAVVGQFQLTPRQASVTGLVVTAEPVPRPVRRAIVTASGNSIVVTATDEQGRYTFGELAPGQYSITASKGGYVDVVYGAPTGQPVASVTLEPGDRRELRTMKLVRGGVLAGRVLSHKGKPIANARVAVIPAQTANGMAVRRTGAVIETPTNDHGEYRLFGLKPGGYVLRVNGPANLPRPDLPLIQQAGLSFAPTFYPGTADLDKIEVVALRAGEERAGLDFQVTFVPITHVSGVVIGADGKPVRAVVSERTRLFQEAALGSVPSLALSRPDGTFVVSNGLAPGRHTLAVFPSSTAANREPGAGATFGVASVLATGDDVAGVTIRLQPAPRLGGRFVFEGATGLPTDFWQRSLSLSETGDSSPSSEPKSIVGPDGAFLFDGVMPGSYTLRFPDAVTARPVTWFPKSAILDGRDVLDVPFDLAAGTAEAGLKVTMTNHPSEISGRVIDKAGAAVTDVVVFVFPEERRYWLPGSRRIQILTIAPDGGFKTVGLPAGNYRLVTLSDLDPSLRDDPAFLEQIASAGLRVVLADGERWSQTLKIGG